MPNLLVVPPQLEYEARLLLNADLIANAAGTAAESNVLRGSATPLVVPELANEPTTWYLMDASKPIKPLVWQQRKAPEFTMKTTPDDDSVFFDGTFLLGVEARGVAGYGPWFLAARAIA
jgi:phage major head subunit gpT-like protein